MRQAAIGRADVLLAAAIVALAAAIQFVLGRPPICTCGRVALWTGTVNGPENSQQLLDWYSPSHVVHGFLFYAIATLLLPRLRVGTRLVLAMLVEAGWELVENSPIIIDRYRADTAAFGYSGDSILNSASDMTMMALGFVLAARLPWRWSVAAVLALELIALAVIRDNLTLNVVMLVHPIAAIRVWQGG